MTSDRTHWTYQLFVQHPELYLPFLEAAKERAAAEVEVLASKFTEFGVPANGRVLDLGCGIGRHDVQLAKRGYRVTGYDLSPLFVQKAGESAASAGVQARFVQGDMREIGSKLAGEGPFDAIFNFFTSFGYHGTKADLELFYALRQLAAPGGLLILETMNREFLVRSPQLFMVQDSPTVVIHNKQNLDLETSSMNATWEIYERSGQDLRFRLRLPVKFRVYSLHELRGLLEEAGWQYLAGFGVTPGQNNPGPVALTSMRLLVCARRGPS